MRAANFCQTGGLILLLCTCGISPLIVPTGLVSLLHYIYSRIPIISKGTDSRVGVGFRFGPHADLQFLVELGPQQHTQSLGDPQNPAPCCGHDEPPGLQAADVPNQLNNVKPAAERAGLSGGRGGGGRKARSGADWLGRWHEGVKGRAQQKSENVASTKNAANSPLLTALQTFRDLWGAGRKAGKLH